MSQRYWGFLSYSHADEASATRLHRALEQYTLPFAVRRSHRLPRRLIPIFRDIDELEAAPGLTKRLEAALDESRWLLVLCSKASAQSSYVNAEVEYFLRRHGSDRILCVLLDGEPPDCFPPAIRALKDEPLAADMRAGSAFELALIKLIAAMAVVDFTELRNREALRKRRLRWSAAAGLAVAALAGVAYWDSYQRVLIDDYAQYVRRDGTWTGIDPISAGEQAPALRYRFTRHGRWNPPERVDYLDADARCPAGGMEDFFAAHLPAAHDAPLQSCIVRFDYSADGRISQETTWARLGADKEVLLGQLTYTSLNYAQVLTHWVPNTRKDSIGAFASTEVHFMQFVRDKRGFDIQLRFMSTPGVLERNRHGDFGYNVAYDDAGHVTRRGLLDEKRLGYTWDAGS